jgi:hypothetical protein
LNKKIINIYNMDSEVVDKVLGIAFNQEGDCFSVATERGFKVFNTLPFQESVTRSLGGSVSKVEMLGRSNILAIVGGGTNPKFSSKCVTIWDEAKSMKVGSLTFQEDIKSIKLCKDLIAIALEKKIYIHELTSLKKVKSFKTASNPKGVMAFSDPESMKFAYPSEHEGEATIYNFDTEEEIA